MVRFGEVYFREKEQTLHAITHYHGWDLGNEFEGVRVERGPVSNSASGGTQFESYFVGIGWYARIVPWIKSHLGTGVIFVVVGNGYLLVDLKMSGIKVGRSGVPGRGIWPSRMEVFHSPTMANKSSISIIPLGS